MVGNDSINQQLYLIQGVPLQAQAALLKDCIEQQDCYQQIYP